MKKGQRKEYCPPPEEIARMCREIQKDWTPEEREKRRHGHLGIGPFAYELRAQARQWPPVYVCRLQQAILYFERQDG